MSLNDLSISDLEAKIKQVANDLELLRSTGESSRKMEILAQYKEFLEDDLKALKNEQQSGKSPR
jgi:outer membrane murein-binding lipoprotein Lpp